MGYSENQHNTDPFLTNPQIPDNVHDSSGFAQSLCYQTSALCCLRCQPLFGAFLSVKASSIRPPSIRPGILLLHTSKRQNVNAIFSTVKLSFFSQAYWPLMFAVKCLFTIFPFFYRDVSLFASLNELRML